MTPERFRECLVVLGWSGHRLTKIVDCSPGLAQGWTNGERSIPPALAEWLERRVTLALANPPPQDWRRPPFGTSQRTGPDGHDVMARS